MEENEKSPQENQFMLPAAIKMKIGLVLTKEYGNYQKVVDELRNAYVGEDNIEQVQNLMRNVNSFLSYGEDKRKEWKEPHLTQGRVIDGEFKTFFAPIIEAKDMIQKKLNIVAAEKQRKIDAENAEKTRVANIQSLINNFVLDYSVKIAAATTNEQLFGYERLINLEKGNKSRYQEQSPLLIERCNELTSKIKEQKELVKEREKIEAEKKKAEESGDEDKLNELMTKEQSIDDKISENTVLVQEAAANSLIPINDDGDTAVMVKARRTIWKAELVNSKEAMKKAPELLEISLNNEKIRDTINTLKDAGVFKGKSEYLLNGIRFFEAKTF